MADFEDGTSPFGTGDTSAFGVAVDGNAWSGTRVLSCTASGHNSVYNQSLQWSVSHPAKMVAHLRLDGGGTNLASFRFGVQDNLTSGYTVTIDARNAEGSGRQAFQIRKSTNGSTLVETNNTPVSVGTWYRVEVDWKAEAPTITARLYDAETDALLETLTSNDTSHTSGGIGVHAFGQASFDDISEAYPEPPTVWDASYSSSLWTFSSGNAVADKNLFGDALARATTAKSTGKWYFEISKSGNWSNQDAAGFADGHAATNQTLGGNSNGWSIRRQSSTDAAIYHNGTDQAAVTPLDSGQRLGFALDLDSGKAWFSIDGAWTSGDPATGSGGYAIASTSWFPAVARIGGSGGGLRGHYVAVDQAYTAPAGFTAWDEVGAGAGIEVDAVAGFIEADGATLTVAVSNNVGVTASSGLAHLVGAESSVEVSTTAIVSWVRVSGIVPFTGSVTVHIDPGAIEAVGGAPAVLASDHVAVDVLAGSANLAGSQPSIATPVAVTAGAGRVEATGSEPTVVMTAHVAIEADAGRADLAGTTPSVAATAHVAVNAVSGAVHLEGSVPGVDVLSGVIVHALAGAAELAGAVPSVHVTAHVSITANAGVAVLFGAVPTVISGSRVANRGDDAPPRWGGRQRQILVYYEEPPPEPEQAIVAPKRRKVTRRAVETAVSLPWAGAWSYGQALEALPQTVPITFRTEGIPETDWPALAVALWLREEQARLEDEDDIELLLLTS